MLLLAYDSPLIAFILAMSYPWRGRLTISVLPLQVMIVLCRYGIPRMELDILLILAIAALSFL
jgi:hypothetical protein